MFPYVKLGFVQYKREPVPRTPINSRAAWEFCACLSGSLVPWLPVQHAEHLRARTLWVFPRRHPHGWLSDAPCERVVFHFNTVPQELERLLPARGYYRVAISDADSVRLRTIAKAAIAAQQRQSELIDLQETAWKSELSLMALREIKPRALSAVRLAQQRVQMALTWFDEHMAENPNLPAIAGAVHTSPAHLRRQFVRATNESPHTALNRLRMEKAEALLRDPTCTLEAIASRVGLSSASALSRAIKVHFGFTPCQLRRSGVHHRTTQSSG